MIPWPIAYIDELTISGSDNVYLHEFLREEED